MAQQEINTVPEKACFNFEKLNTYLGTDRQVIKEIMHVVLEELRIAVQKLEDFICSGNLDAIRAMAKRLISTATSVGLNRICTVVKKLEQQQTFDAEILEQRLAVLKAETVSVKKLITNYL